MKAFQRSWWRRLKRFYWRWRAERYVVTPDKYLGFNPWRVRIAEDEVVHGETYTLSEVIAHLKSIPDSRTGAENRL